MTTKIFRKSALFCSPFPIISRFFVVAILCLVVPGFMSPPDLQSSSSLSFFADAYRVGDTVDAVISTRSALTIDMMIANQPLFGVTKTVYLPRLPERISLSFDEGLYTLPYTNAAITEKIVVTFVYSKSGAGRIHSVTSKATVSYTKRFDPSKDIEVVFDWVEEAAVDFTAGSIVMFLAVFLVSIMFLLQLCNLKEPDDYDDRNDGRHESYYKGR